MREKEVRWIKSRIREYYERAPLKIKHIEKREFGIGNWNKKIEERHLCFSSVDELRGFLIERAPLYISYSTAYYKKPCNRPMEAKEREGVELTFDMDGESSNMVHINRVKDELKKLIFILKNDFGIKEYMVNFSGNRGFHLHVYDKEFLNLGPTGRKRIVEYLLGNFDYKKLFYINEGKLLGPMISDHGFRGRFAREFVRIIKNEPHLLGRKIDKTRWEKSAKTGNYSLIPIRSNKKILDKLRVVMEKIKMKSIDIDAGVTYDMSKLIRMPDSIHGSTGFIAKSIEEKEIDGFNPYKDANPFGDEKVEVIYIKNFVMIENGRRIIKRKGMKEKIKRAIAFHLIIKGFAIIS